MAKADSTLCFSTKEATIHFYFDITALYLQTFFKNIIIPFNKINCNSAK